MKLVQACLCDGKNQESSFHLCEDRVKLVYAYVPGNIGKAVFFSSRSASDKYTGIIEKKLEVKTPAHSSV